MYWQKRQNLNYYKVARSILDRLEGDTIIDIGSRDTPVVTWGDFKHRISVDIILPYSALGVESVQQDWMLYTGTADVITCLQVLEHLNDPKPFLLKILQSSKIAIISVPHMQQSKHHKQDPVTLEKLLSWSDKKPQHLTYVWDGRWERIVAVFCQKEGF